MPASRKARAITFAPRSCPSNPGLATRTRIGRVLLALFVVSIAFVSTILCCDSFVGLFVTGGRGHALRRPACTLRQPAWMGYPGVGARYDLYVISHLAQG